MPSRSMTVAEALVERLGDWGVQVIFGLPGDGINGLMVDPFEPPMPARITSEQAAHIAKALLRGEPHRGRIALTLFRDKVHELF